MEFVAPCAAEANAYVRRNLDVYLYSFEHLSSNPLMEEEVEYTKTYFGNRNVTLLRRRNYKSIFAERLYWDFYWALLGLLLGSTGSLVGIYWASCWDLLGLLVGSTGTSVGIFIGICWDLLGFLLGSTGTSIELNWDSDPHYK